MEMRKAVAADPMGHAVFYRTMLECFMETLVGSSRHGCRSADGVASNGAGGVFGDVLAYHGPEEGQGRGSRHFHMIVWLIGAALRRILRKMRRAQEGGEDVEILVSAWVQSVLTKVSSMQFDSVLEVAPFLGVGGAERGPEKKADEPLATRASTTKTWHQWRRGAMTK